MWHLRDRPPDPDIAKPMRLTLITHQLNRRTLHLVVHVDVGLGRRDALVAGERSQNSHTDAFACQRCDEAASAGMARSSIDASVAIKAVEGLTQRIG